MLENTLSPGTKSFLMYVIRTYVVARGLDFVQLYLEEHCFVDLNLRKIARVFWCHFLFAQPRSN